MSNARSGGIREDWTSDADDTSEPLGPKTPTHEAREPDDETKPSEGNRKAEHPSLLRQRRDSEERDADREECFADVELVVLHIELFVLLLEALHLDLELRLLLFVPRRFRSVRFDE